MNPLSKIQRNDNLFFLVKFSHYFSLIYKDFCGRLNQHKHKGCAVDIDPLTNHIPSCECNKFVSAFLLFCKRGDFVFQTVFSDCWKFKRKEKLNRIFFLFLYGINDLLFLIQNHEG